MLISRFRRWLRAWRPRRVFIGALGVSVLFGGLLLIFSEGGPQGPFTLFFGRDHWVTSWGASGQGPYPSGYTEDQPNLRFVFPNPEQGARDQSFRMIIRPDVWGREMRVRFSNAFGTKPVTFDGIFAGRRSSSSEIVPGSNRQIKFAGFDKVTVKPGATVWSDPVPLDYVQGNRDFLQGQKLAISFHAVGSTGPMTWHAKALTTSYITAPGEGSRGWQEGETAFPYSVTSWFFLDAVDMKMPKETTAVVAFGDSITDGHGATLNGDDRWPDILSRFLHARYGDRFAVVNEGIAGNQIAWPTDYSPAKPEPGGPAAVSRLDRDLLTLSGVSAVIWLEGTNDLSGRNFSSMETVKSGLNNGVGQIRSHLPAAKVVGATLTSARGSPNASYGSPEYEVRRQTFNKYLWSSGIFDFVADFDEATVDIGSGELRPEMAFNTATSGPGDKLHPNRLGDLGMGAAAENVFLQLADQIGGVAPGEPKLILWQSNESK